MHSQDWSHIDVKNTMWFQKEHVRKVADVGQKVCREVQTQQPSILLEIMTNSYFLTTP